MERLLPRHMQIIYLINAIHLAQMSKLPDVTGERLSRCRSSMKRMGGAFVWAISRFWARTR